MTRDPARLQTCHEWKRYIADSSDDGRSYPALDSSSELMASSMNCQQSRVTTKSKHIQRSYIASSRRTRPRSPLAPSFSIERNVGGLTLRLGERELRMHAQHAG
ncbi:MAG: hypothetical protein MHM6MM_001140 [Cercozoa sp. M6MM]